MSWTKQFDIDLTASGDRVNNGFAKYESERDYIYGLLNRVRTLDFGNTEPTDRIAGSFWADTNSGYLKARNDTNSDWIALGKLSNEMGHVVGLGDVTSIENGTSAPTASRSGRIFLDTTNGNLYYDTGTLVSIIATQQWSNLVGKPTTLAGFDITDAYTKAEIDAHVNATTGIHGATTNSTASTLVLRDTNGDVPSNAVSASKLKTARNISISGDGTGTASFDGSADASIALTLANSGATAGSYNGANVTVDAKGRITAASQGTCAFTLTVVPAFGLASAPCVIPFAMNVSRVDITSKTAAGADQAPSSSTNMAAYKNGSSALTQAFTTANTTNSSVSLALAAGDIVYALQSAANGTAVVSITFRGVRA